MRLAAESVGVTRTENAALQRQPLEVMACLCDLLVLRRRRFENTIQMMRAVCMGLRLGHAYPSAAQRYLTSRTQLTATIWFSCSQVLRGVAPSAAI